MSVRSVGTGRPWHLTFGFALLWGALGTACGDSDEDDDDTSGGTIVAVGGNGGTGATSSGTAGSGNTPTGTGTGSGVGGSGACGHAGEPEPSRLVGMTAAHNAVRCAVNPSSGGALPPLQWSSTVASFAQINMGLR